MKRERMNMITCSPHFCFYLTCPVPIYHNKVRATNYIPRSLWDIITPRCRNFNGVLTKPPFKLWRGWVITSCNANNNKWPSWCPIRGCHVDIAFDLRCAVIILYKSWWRHQMKTFSALLAFGVGNPPDTGEFPTQKPVTRALMFPMICAWTNGWVNNREAGDLRRHRANDDVIVRNTQ